MELEVYRDDPKITNIFRWDWYMTCQNHEGNNFMVGVFHPIFLNEVRDWFSEINLPTPEIRIINIHNDEYYKIVFSDRETAILFKTTWL